MVDDDAPASSAPLDPAARKLYGRRRSHKLRPGLSGLMADLLPALRVPGIAPGAALDPAALFEPRPRAVRLEIGFGGGEHLIHCARAEPDIGFIGCEHYVDGVAKLLASVRRAGLETVRVHPHDARDLIEALAPGSLDRAYLLYPDPWPKKRHHKRRFMNAENLDLLARALAPGAELRVASDIDDYIRHALAAVHAHPAFAWTATGPDDWRRPWPDWPGTRYEAKALREGRTPTYLRFARL